MDTFVVRVWVPGQEIQGSAAEGALRGVVEHIRSGSSHEFRHTEELVERLRHMAGLPEEREKEDRMEVTALGKGTGPRGAGCEEGARR